MNIKDLLNRFNGFTGKDAESTPWSDAESATGSAQPDEALQEAAVAQIDDEEVGRGTKVKVIAALLVAGFASYIAWWVQEPATLRTDILGGNTQTEQSMQTQTGAIEVSIVNLSFNPPEISVAKGATVVWTNHDAVQQTVTGQTFSSGTLNSGESYSYTFENDGTFTYSSSFYPQMQGRVIVGAGAATEPLATPLGGTAQQLPEMIVPDTTHGAATAAMEENTEQILGLGMGAGTGTQESEQMTEQTAAEREAAAAALSASQQAEEQFAADAMADAAQDEKTLAKSGPEDIFYVGAFVVILFLNRKRLFHA